MNEYLVKIDKALDEYLVKKAPVLPQNIKDLLVKIAPWFAIIGIIFGIPAILAAFGLGAFATPFVWLSGSRTGMFWIWWIIMVVQVTLGAMSVKPLFARNRQGWVYMYYSQLLSVLSSLGNLSVGGLLFTALSFYFLYQIKGEYK